ncbi:hypothetical protein BASA81_012831 [Batrachochytrium salamandrivorans]|nr:hypothetical protein BASA81_012831 [Batrachochytrium salamandrivorans]
MSSASKTALFRKLLLRVHPDVVASQSDRFRTHNEATLKVLMSCLDNTSSPGHLPKIHFYLRDGGRTATVLFNPQNPTLGLQVLLGEAPPPSQETTKPISSKHGSDEGEGAEAIARRKATHQNWQNTLNQWWNSRARNVDNMELLYRQNRIRFVSDFLDWKSPVVPQSDHKFAIESALGLVKNAFELYVDDSTLDALLEAPELRKIEFRIVGKNLYRPYVRDNTVLCVPVGCPPEVFGREIDLLVDRIVRDVVLSAGSGQQV